MNPFSYRLYFSQNPESYLRQPARPNVNPAQPGVEFLLQQMNRVRSNFYFYENKHDLILNYIYYQFNAYNYYFERFEIKLDQIGQRISDIEARVAALESGKQIVRIM